MGCGASKGGEAVAPSALPSGQTPKTEFTPESKPTPASQPEGASQTKDPRQAAKRVDEIVKTGVVDFDDDTDPKQDTQSGPLQVAVEPVLPPPPSTLPAAATKPLFQTSNGFGSSGGGGGRQTAGDADELSYFPEQVPLKVGGADAGGGGGGFAPFPTQRTPLQSLDAPSGFQPVALTSQGSQQQPQQLASVSSVPPAGRQSGSQQPTPLSTLLPPLQSQPQPLSESGPGPSGHGSYDRASTSATQVPNPPASNDPWSSLQNQYRIREPHPAEQAADPTSTYGSRNGGGAGSLRGVPPDAGREVLVLGDDDDFGGGRGMNTTMNRTARSQAAANAPPPRPGAQPKKGGWGSGELARAGDLMIGSEDDWLEADRPPGASGSLASQLPPPPVRQPAVPQSAQKQAVVSYSSGRQRSDFDDRELSHHTPPVLKGPKTKGKEEVLCEDIEDVDTMLEAEMERAGLSNKTLASKLAAYEAQFADDD